MSADTERCTLRVIAVVPVRGSGRLVAMAGVELEIAGVELLLLGVQVVRGPGGLECRPPQFRDADGQWAPSIVLPIELREAMAAAVLDMVRDMSGRAGPSPIPPYTGSKRAQNL